MLIGPAQVAGRVLELSFGRKIHPIWTLLTACGLVAAGILLLFAGLPVPGLWLALYGAGNGILTIAHGAVPLVLFGEHDYPILMGRLSLPVLVAQAAGPSLGDLVMKLGGADKLTVVWGRSVGEECLALQRDVLRVDADRRVMLQPGWKSRELVPVPHPAVKARCGSGTHE